MTGARVAETRVRDALSDRAADAGVQVPFNLMHIAQMLRVAGGIPAYGNQRTKWDAGCRPDFANPDYR